MRKVLAVLFPFCLFALEKEPPDYKKAKHWLEKHPWIKKVYQKGVKWAKKWAPYLEGPPQKTPPKKVKKLKKPRFVFAQIADLHLWGRNFKYLDRAMGFLKKKVRPHFVIFTGDNVVGPYRKKEQKILKQRLEHWKIPYFIVRGDNDAVHFESTFGSSHWAFVYGGIQFVGIALDYDIDWVGIGFFEQLDWLKKMLRRPYPTILVLHQPVWPYTFWNAPEVLKIMESHPNLFLALYGHLHYDFTFQKKHITHVLAPSLRLHPKFPLKVYRIYSTCVVVCTYGWERGQYRPYRWRVVELPTVLPSQAPLKVIAKKELLAPVQHVESFSEMFQKVFQKRWRKWYGN